MNEISDLPDETDEPLDEVQELVWALVDDQATQTENDRLEQLLLGSEEARHTYVMCMQMHADLHFLLGPKSRLPEVLQKAIEAEKAKPSKTPLPLVDLPSVGSDVSIVNGCM